MLSFPKDYFKSEIIPLKKRFQTNNYMLLAEIFTVTVFLPP